MNSVGKKGSILLHSVIMAVLLATISAMIMKLFFGRYAVASKTQRSSRAKLLVERCLAEKTGQWDIRLLTKKQLPPVGKDTCQYGDITVDVNVSGSDNEQYKDTLRVEATLDYSDL